MQRICIILLSIVLSFTATAAVYGQFTISIPKIPKIKKDKPASSDSSNSNEDSAPTGQAAAEQTRQADVPRAGECGKLDGVNQVRVDLYKKDLQELLQDAKSFNGDRGWYSPEFNEDWLLAAISPSTRQKLATKYGELYPCISGLLDEIQAAAKISLPKYTLYSYNTRSPADERVIRSAISDLNQAKVFKVGLEGRAWLIQKNSFGIPEKRYKHGAMWVKYSNWDHGYCQILWINVIQDYAGGGTWGSSYGNFIRSEPAGCPTK